MTKDCDSSAPPRKAEARPNSELTSLATPWSLMLLVSVVATVVYTVMDESNDEEFANDFFQDSSSEPSPWQRFLQTATGTGTAATTEHVHKQIFEEVHKPLFPLDASDRLGFTCAILGLMLAAGGGIGGGGILVPIYILVMDFSPKHAIPLSNITVLGGALANMLLNIRKRHPLADRPLVDWDLILVMEPLTIAGALIGAFLNKLLPELFLTVMLVVLLSFTAYTTLKKALKMYKAESRKLKEQGFKEDGTPASELTKIEQQGSAQATKQAADELLKNMELQEGEVPGYGGVDNTPEWKLNQQLKLDLEKILDEERVTPKLNIVILVVMFVVIITINLLKGGGAFPSPLGIECGSTGFWLANDFMLFWILVISAGVRHYLVQRYEEKKRVGYKYLEGDIQWDGRATVVYPVVCCLAGFFAGMFGIGTYPTCTSSHPALY